MKACRVVIKGRVQGVWFRATADRTARRLGVAGWVRNAPDGSVEAFVQGGDEAVRKMIEWCRKGPPGAFVESVETVDTDPVEECRSFNIRYY